MIEITAHEPTHYMSESMILSKIDRVLTGIPSHAWLSVAPLLSNALRPEIAHAKGLSDHAIIIVSVSSRAKPDPEAMPIKNECFEHPKFKERLVVTRRQVDLAALPTWEALGALGYPQSAPPRCGAPRERCDVNHGGRQRFQHSRYHILNGSGCLDRQHKACCHCS